MVSRMKVLAFGLVAVTLLCGSPHRVLADEAAAQKEHKAAEDKKDSKGSDEKNKNGNFKHGVNRAFDGFKKETGKGKKNLNDLYDRSKEK